MSNWQQVTAPIMSTVDYPGMCARFQWKAFGARNGWGFGSATQAWAGQVKKHPGERPPAGVAVPIWFSWTGDPNGHAAVSLADGRVLTSPVSPNPFTMRQDIFPSIESMMAAFGGGMTYLGWGEQMDGTVVVKPLALGPMQRQVKSGGKEAEVVRRTQPTSKSADLQPPLAPNTVADFDGWINGESVGGNSVWFRGAHSGNWFWSGGFTSQSTANLKDLNAPAPTPTQRTAGAYPVVRRTQPTRQSADKQPQLAAGATITVYGWTNGEKIDGNSVWFKESGSGDWFWSGGFTSQSTANLVDLNSTTPPVDPGPDPSEIRGPGPVLSQIDDWDASAPEFGTAWPRPKMVGDLELPGTIIQTSSTPEGGYYVGRPDKPNHIVLHHAVSESLSGAINTLKGKTGAPTATYVVKDHQAVAMVDEADTPSTNTRWRSNQYSTTIEVCNHNGNYGKPSDESHETTAWLAARSAIRWGMRQPLEYGVNVFGHRDLSKSATTCPGDLDVDWIIRRANDIIESGGTVEPPVNPGFPDVAELTAAIRELNSTLNKIYRTD